MLFHISEELNIERFEPRASEYTDTPVVWAVDAERLRNYLVPRECPRVTFYAGRDTTVADRERFLGSSSEVVTVESRWLARLRSCRLFCYHLRQETFACLDECAGYYVSRVAVEPAQVETFDDPMVELLRRGVELRLMPELWTLSDAVAASSLRFSIIRMRNALRRGTDQQRHAPDRE
jgi:hypothetical protein